MSIATDVRTYADTALEQGKTALAQASTIVTSANKRLSADAVKPAYVAVGAADLVAETITKRIEALPADAFANLNKAQETSKARITKAQSDAIARIEVLRSKVDARIDEAKGLRNVDVTGAAKQASDGYLTLAKSLYGTLTARGEAKVSELRKDPRFAKLLGDINDVTATVEAKVSPVLNSVIDRVEGKPAHKAAVQKPVTPATKKAPAAKKTPAAPAAKKAPVARKSAAKKAPAQKVTATKAPARKAPAKKAAPSA